MNATSLDTIIIHYNEIALKGGNRHIFEHLLVDNIKAHLDGLPNVSVQNVYGRIIVKAGVTADNKQIFIERLKRVFGISSFSFGIECAQKMEDIERAAVDVIKFYIEARLLPQAQHEAELHRPTFKIETKRSDKGFKLNSLEISKQVGSAIVEKPGLKVDVNNPDIICFIELANKKTLLYAEKYEGAGGLPTDSSAPMLGFLSGGIDSPAACSRLMRRGARVIFLHFHSYPQTSKASIDKVKELAEVLNQYQLNSKLYLAPFLEIQKQILMESKADLRVILYRRFMMRIANEIAKRENVRAFITGENLGQVASQTAENMAVIEGAAKFPIFRPFIGYDKNEIIDEARALGTYEISIRPHDDCCQVFMPEHPATKARLEDVEREEGKFDTKKLIEDAVKKAEIVKYTA